MSRLPTPGSDDGIWGDILNDFLSQEHNSDGSQKTLGISKGGTGATDATTARTNLGTIADSDSRLTDDRTPTDGSVTNAKVSDTAAIAESKLNLASDSAAGTPSRRTLGTGATQAAAGSDLAALGTRVGSVESSGDLFLATYFKQPFGGGGQGGTIPRLCFGASGDGKEFSEIGADLTLWGSPTYTYTVPAAQDFTFLDVDGRWYYTGTSAEGDPGQRYIEVYGSDSLQPNAWTQVAVIDIQTARPTAVRGWAPQFFVDDDGSIYLIITMGDGALDTTPGNPFRPYAFKADNRQLTSWTAAGKLTRTGTRPGQGSWDDESTIDTVVVRHGGQYHAISKESRTFYLQHWVADNLLGPWTMANDGLSNSLGFGVNAEAPSLEKLANGEWRLYFDDSGLVSSGQGGGQPMYSESSDLATWTAKTKVVVPGGARHMDVRRYNSARVRDQVLRLALTGRGLTRPGQRPFAEVSKTNNQSIAVGASPAISMNARVDPEGLTTGNRIKVPHNSVYTVRGQVIWDANGITAIWTVQVVVLGTDGSTVRISAFTIEKGVGDQRHCTVTKDMWLYEGEFLELRASHSHTSAVSVYGTAPFDTGVFLQMRA